MLAKPRKVGCRDRAGLCLSLREVGVSVIPCPPGPWKAVARPLPSPALGLVSCRACQAELSTRVRRDDFPLGATLGPALPTAGKESSVLAQDWAASSGWVLLLVSALTFTLPDPL